MGEDTDGDGVERPYRPPPHCLKTLPAPARHERWRNRSARLPSNDLPAPAHRGFEITSSENPSNLRVSHTLARPSGSPSVNVPYEGKLLRCISPPRDAFAVELPILGSKHTMFRGSLFSWVKHKNRSRAPVSLPQTAIRVIQLPNLGSIADLTPPTNAPVQKPPDVVCIPHPPGQKRDIPTRHARSPPPSQDP